MLAVVSFDLLPESFSFGGNFIPILFFVIGVITAILLENVINKFMHLMGGHKARPYKNANSEFSNCGRSAI